MPKAPLPRGLLRLPGPAACGFAALLAQDLVSQKHRAASALFGAYQPQGHLLGRCRSVHASRRTCQQGLNEQLNLVGESRGNQLAVQYPPAFDPQRFHAPPLVEPLEGGSQIDVIDTADEGLDADPGQVLEVRSRSAGSGQSDRLAPRAEFHHRAVTAKSTPRIDHDHEGARVVMRRFCDRVRAGGIVRLGRKHRVTAAQGAVFGGPSCNLVEQAHVRLEPFDAAID